MPKILIDGFSMIGNLSGIGRYTYEISTNLEKISRNNISYDYGFISKKLICGKLEQNKNLAFLENSKKMISKIPYAKKIARKILDKIPQPEQNFDLYFQPNFIPREQIKAKHIVTTIHDFAFLLHRDFHPKERLDYFDKNFFSSVSRSSHIITVSNFIKEEIKLHTNFKDEQISVIYNGIDHNNFKIYDYTELEAVKNKFKLYKKFILFVGSIEPRKNLLNLLEAYSQMSKNLKNEFDLVIIGAKGWENSQIHDKINALKENVKFLGFVNDIELAKIYNQASLFVYPSFYEGFGIPPIEAMACGAPCLVSNASCIPEICGNFAEYLDPNNINDIKDNIESLLKDEEKREQMSQNGLLHAKTFSWKKSAKEHLKVFQRFL